MEEVTSTLDSRKSVDIIYLDFAKALKKLNSHGIGEILYYGYNLGLLVEDRK